MNHANCGCPEGCLCRKAVVCAWHALSEHTGTNVSFYREQQLEAGKMAMEKARRLQAQREYDERQG